MAPLPLGDDDARRLAEVSVRFAMGWVLEAPRGYCNMHAHATLEIIYHTRGRGTVTLEGEDSVDFGPQTVHLVAPGRRHDQQSRAVGEDRCVHLHIDGMPAELVEGWLTIPRLADAYARHELTALSEAPSHTDAMEHLCLSRRAHAVLVRLIQLARGGAAVDVSAPGDHHAERAFDYIGRHCERLTRLCEVADHVGVSHDHLRHVFRDRYGMSLQRHLVLARIDRAKELLTHSALPVKAIARQCGFANDRYFCTLFRREVNVTPRSFRRGSRGAASP